MRQNLTNDLPESILEKIIPSFTVQVESSTDIQAWAPILFEMRNDTPPDVFSSINFNEDGTKIILETTDLSKCGLNILITVQKFKDLLGFFVERTRQGDIISVWESVPELNNLIDQISETKKTTDDSEREIEKLTTEEKLSNEFKFSTPEELAVEILSFSKKKFPDQDDERPIPFHVIIGYFWRSKSVNLWNLPADLKFRIKKAERLVQKQLEQQREIKRNEKMLSLVTPCIEWAKERGLTKVTEGQVITFLSEREVDLSPRTKKRALQAVVNSKIKNP
ncbi:MAG: hypothetical protein LUQ66_05340 [Methanoregula sp.]|nr:hypothetical protein [Methanoregula sp.]